MIRNLLTILTFSIFLYSSAQNNYNTASMVVSKADLENNTFKKDSTANAFFIYEKGYSRVENGGNYNLLTDYKAKIKIRNEQGFDKATLEVVLYRDKSNKELFRNLVAYTHNLEQGKIVKTKLEEDQIYKEKYSENHTLIKFTFPNIKPGSVLTYKYQVESPFIYKFNGWDFQDDIPKLYSQCIADLPGNYVYNIKLVGDLKLSTNESTIKKRCLEVSHGGYADCVHNVYVMKDIPAFREEEYMTAKENYFSRIDYELEEYKSFDGAKKKYTETWKNVDDKLKKHANIGLQLKKINTVKDILPTNIQTKPNDIDKAKTIYNYISKHYKWDKNYRIFKEGNIKKLIENKTGNVSSINILLHNVLKQQQFDVAPILLSTRNNGYVTKIYPVVSDFNYLITQLSIDGNTYLLDATENMLAFGEVPFRCLNQQGRLFDFKSGSSWVDIKPKKQTSYFYQEKIILDENLNLTGSAKHVSSGYHGYFKRKEFDQVNKEKYLDNIKKQDQEVVITEISVKNESDPEKAFEEEFKFTRSPEIIDDLIYIKPFTRPFFVENPFKLNERTYPVDFGYKDSYTYFIVIELPKGYEFTDLPKPSKYAIPNKLGSVVTNLQVNKNQLIISHRILFNSSYYPPEYYTALKEFFNLIVNIENDMLITVKKMI